MSASNPRALLVYNTYTQQAGKVVEAMADVLRERGVEVELVAIEFTDKRYVERFSRFPLRHRYSTSSGFSRRSCAGRRARSGSRTKHATATLTSSASARRPGG